MSDLVERLRRTKSPAVTMRRVSEGHYRGTNAIYVNPDGNEAAARITALEAENERLRKALAEASEDEEIPCFIENTEEANPNKWNSKTMWPDTALNIMLS